jgi:hypothetical protein
MSCDSLCTSVGAAPHLPQQHGAVASRREMVRRSPHYDMVDTPFKPCKFFYKSVFVVAYLPPPPSLLTPTTRCGRGANSSCTPDTPPCSPSMIHISLTACAPRPAGRYGREAGIRRPTRLSAAFDPASQAPKLQTAASGHFQSWPEPEKSNRVSSPGRTQGAVDGKGWRLIPSPSVHVDTAEHDRRLLSLNKSKHSPPPPQLKRGCSGQPHQML